MAGSAIILWQYMIQGPVLHCVVLALTLPATQQNSRIDSDPIFVFLCIVFLCVVMKIAIYEHFRVTQARRNACALVSYCEPALSQIARTWHAICAIHVYP